MKTVGFFVNTSKPHALQVATEACGWLRKHGVKPLVPDAEAALLGLAGAGCNRRELAAQCDLLLVLGGDGTLLDAAHIPTSRMSRSLLRISVASVSSRMFPATNFTLH